MEGWNGGDLTFMAIFLEESLALALFDGVGFKYPERQIGYLLHPVLYVYYERFVLLGNNSLDGLIILARYSLGVAYRNSNIVSDEYIIIFKVKSDFS